MNRIRAAVIGCGHLGSIHAKLLAARSDVELIAVSDPIALSRSRLAQECACNAVENSEDLSGRVDVVVIAAPTCLHESVSMPLIEAGIHVFIEKPLATTASQAKRLVAAAHRHRCVVAVGHVERVNPAWKASKVGRGQLISVEAVRRAPFTYRSLDVGVVLDLMIHDIDLLLSLSPGNLKNVEAIGIVATGGHEDAVRARLLFDSGVMATLTASRISPVLERKIDVWSTETMVSIDFNAKSISVLEPSEDVRQGKFNALSMVTSNTTAAKDRFFTDVLHHTAPAIPEGNAIVSEHDDFLDAVRQSRKPTVSGEDGLRAIEVAEAILESLTLSRMGQKDQSFRLIPSSDSANAFDSGWLQKTG